MLRSIVLLSLVGACVCIGLGRKQSAGVRGTLVCDGKPLKNVKVKLYDNDRGNISGSTSLGLCANTGRGGTQARFLALLTPSSRFKRASPLKGRCPVPLSETSVTYRFRRHQNFRMFDRQRDCHRLGPLSATLTGTLRSLCRSYRSAGQSGNNCLPNEATATVVVVRVR